MTLGCGLCSRCSFHSLQGHFLQKMQSSWIVCLQMERKLVGQVNSLFNWYAFWQSASPIVILLLLFSSLVNLSSSKSVSREITSSDCFICRRTSANLIRSFSNSWPCSCNSQGSEGTCFYIHFQPDWFWFSCVSQRAAIYVPIQQPRQFDRALRAFGRLQSSASSSKKAFNWVYVVAHKSDAWTL